MTDDSWVENIRLTRSQAQLRIKAHQLFDPIWKLGLVDRKTAYRMLAADLGVMESEAHFGFMGAEKLEKALPVISALRSRLEAARRPELAPYGAKSGLSNPGTLAAGIEALRRRWSGS